MKFDNPTVLGDFEMLPTATVTGLGESPTPTLKDILEMDYDPEESLEIETETDKVDKVENSDKTEPNQPVKQNEPVANSEYEDLSAIAPAVAQLLANKGFFNELPEGVDEENFDEEALIKTFQHNLKLSEQKSFEDGISYERDRLVGSLPETGLKLVEFLDNPNLDDEDVKNYLRSVIFENDITRLDPEDNYDAEKIVRAFYSNDNRFTNDEVESKIADLIQLDRLKKEAAILKPKVDAQASKMAQDQIESKRFIQEQEKQRQGHLVARTKEMLSKGMLNGVSMTREDAELAFKLIVNNDIPVPVKGGKNIEMGFAELEVFKHKFTKEGNLENLALGLLVMAKGTEVIERYFAKKATTQATNEFIKEQKFNFQKKSGGGIPSVTTKGKSDFDFPFINK